MDLVVVVDTGFTGAEYTKDIHVPDSQWESMSESDRESFMQDEIDSAISENISGEWKTAEEYYG